MRGQIRMKDLKRIIALLVTACMLLTLVVFAADVETADSSVVTDPVYQANVAKLTALGLWALADVDNAQAATVTRGEYAELMVSMVGMKGQSTTASPVFRDVTSDNPHYNAISILYSLKIITGEYGSLYRPDEAITYNEAMKFLMSVLGYSQYADEVGGYPVGYMKAAREQGLSLGDVSGSQELTRNNVATLLVSSLDVSLLKRYVYGKGSVYYSKTDNVTLLSEYFNIYKSLEVINAVGPTRINEGVRLMEGIADIGGVTFNVGSTNAIDYIGYKVYAYFKEDKNAARNTLLYVDPVKNTVYDLNSDEISTYDPVSGRLNYYTDVDKGKKSYITIKTTDNIIYNNVRTKNFTKADFETADRIKAIDNNNDGNFEAVFIENEEVFMVKSINTSDHKVFDNYKAGGVLDIESDGMTKIVSVVDRYGNEVDVNSITFGSVLNVVRSKPDASGAMTTTIVVTNLKMSGTVSEILHDGSDIIYVINNEQYKFSKNQDSIDSAIGLSTIKIGNTYKFYLDKNNKIAGIDTAGSSTEQYGFMVSANMGKGIDLQPTVRIYTKNREFLDTKLADNVIINDKKRLSGLAAMGELLGRTLAEKPEGSVIVGVAIRYKLNSDNQISSLIMGTVPDVTADTYNYGSQKLYQYPLGNSNPMYLRDVGLFDGRIRIDGNTTVIIVPTLTSQFDDIDKFGIGNMDTFKSFAGVDYNMIRFYDVSKERTAGLVVYQAKKPGGTEIDRNTRITVVTKISSVVNDEGEETLKLYGMQSGKEISVPVEAGLNFVRYYNGKDANGVLKRVPQTVERGDIIRYAVNDKGELNDYEKVFDLDDQDDPNIIKRFTYEGYTTIDPVTGVPEESTDTEMSGMDCMISITDQYPVTDKNGDTGQRYTYVFQGSNKYPFYAVQYKVYYATLMDKVGDTIIYKVPKSKSQSEKTEIASLSRFTITVIDKTQDLIYPSNESELTPASVVGENNATKMIMYLAGGIPRDIIIIKQ